jgi:hypothetical protein
VILFTYGVFNIYLRIKRPVYLFTALALLAASNGYYLWHYFRDLAPLGYVTGQERRTAYLARTLPEYPAFQYVNRELPATAKIYLLFMGRRAYYCEREYFHDGGELPGFLLQAIQSAKEPGDLARRLKALRLTHLLVRDELLIRFLRDNLNPAQQRVWDTFTANHLTALFRERGYSVLQLHD